MYLQQQSNLDILRWIYALHELNYISVCLKYWKQLLQTITNRTCETQNLYKSEDVLICSALAFICSANLMKMGKTSGIKQKTVLDFDVVISLCAQKSAFSRRAIISYIISSLTPAWLFIKYFGYSDNAVNKFTPNLHSVYFALIIEVYF